MKSKSIGFIGGGRITKIILQGLSNKKALPESLKVFEPNDAVLKALQTDFPSIVAVATATVAATQDLVFIAVHPPVVSETLESIQDVVSRSTVLVSLAPKITLEKMASIVPLGKLVRMIPNATSIIDAGYNPVSFGRDCDISDKEVLIDLLRNLGETFETEEAKLEAYAITSAMLPLLLVPMAAGGKNWPGNRTVTGRSAKYSFFNASSRFNTII